MFGPLLLAAGDDDNVVLTQRSVQTLAARLHARKKKRLWEGYGMLIQRNEKSSALMSGHGTCLFISSIFTAYLLGFGLDIDQDLLFLKVRPEPAAGVVVIGGMS